VPEEVKAWVGFWLLLVPPSPKFQAQEVGVLVEVSVKVTLWPVTGAAGENVNDAAGTTAEGVGTPDEEEEPPPHRRIRRITMMSSARKGL